MRKWFLRAVGGFCLGAAAAVGLYFLPPVHDRLAWRVDNLVAQVHYLVYPPEKAVFVPQQSVDQIVQATLSAVFPSSTPGETARPSETPAPSNTPSASAEALLSPTAPSTPTTVPTPVPSSVLLKGVVHEYEKENNCGPATLAMALTYWGWKGSQNDTAPFLKPNPKDKNVMPYELQNYIGQKTSFKSVLRYGGNEDLLKHLVAAGLVVIVEKGFEAVDLSGVLSWMGHYEAIIGYNDAASTFYAEDSYSQKDDNTPLAVSYKEMDANWRAFNYTYLVIYPQDRQAQVFSILGPQADEQADYRYAAQKASDEIPTLAGRDLFFAWFNRGSSLVDLQDYGGAASAYDQAFAVYPSIPDKKRPWRMLWYQTGPYFAYFYSGRYADVINLASTTLDAASEPALEESWVWRARAEAATGNTTAAISDLRTSLQWHPGFAPALDALNSLGATP